MDMEKYINKYTNVSREELEKKGTLYFNRVSESVFESLVSSLHEDRAREKEDGRAAIRTRPLVHVLSVNIQPKNEKKDSPLVIYGKIYAEKKGGAHELFNRERGDGEVLGTSNSLSLIGPDVSCYPPRTCTPLSWINVMLYDGDDNIFAKDCFCLDDAQVANVYEEVKFRTIPCVQGSLTVSYILIPFGVSCRLEVQIRDRHFGNDYVNVNGRVVVRYGNTGECVLFEKQNSDFEHTKFDNKKALLKMPRCWVASPAYSPLIVTLDLSEFGTNRKILNNTIALLPQAGLASEEEFLQEEMGLFIRVEAGWFLPDPSGICKSSDDEESDDDLSSNLELPWSLNNPHKNNLWPLPAVEIFSIFIGREKSTAIQIYGSVEVLIDDEAKFYIFKRDEKDALRLEEDVNTTPILEYGSRHFEYYSSLGMKFDIKDVDGCLAIKGFVDWDAEVLGSDFYHEKQLCSSITGQNGFAAVHYSIFSNAVWANIKIYLNLKKRSVYPKVFGSLVTQYSCYDYSTQYNQDYYRIVLFKRSEDDSAEPSANRTIPLSRSMVVVPSYSSLVVNMNLSFGDSFGQMLSCDGSMKIKISESSKTIETNDYSLRMELDWCEIK